MLGTSLTLRARLQACVDPAAVGGVVLKRGIDTALRNSRRMIAFVSPGFFTRLWCLFEAWALIRIRQKVAILGRLPS